MNPAIDNATNTILDNLQFFREEVGILLTANAERIKDLISNGHTTIIVLVSVTIALTIIMGTAILIRQQKIMKMLRDLTPPKAESPREEDTAAKETE